MSQDKTEKKTPVGKYLSIKDMPPDHPFYKRGFVIGGKNSSHFPSQRPSKNEDTGNGLAVNVRKIFENHIEYRAERDEYLIKGKIEDFYCSIMDGIIRWLRNVLKMSEYIEDS